MRRSNAPSLKRQLPDAETAKEPVADAAAPPAPKAPRVVPSRPLLHAVKPVVAAPSNLAATPADPAAVAKSLYFSVVWCKAAAANRKVRHTVCAGARMLTQSPACQVGGRRHPDGVGRSRHPQRHGGERVRSFLLLFLKLTSTCSIGTTTSYGANTLATLGDGETIQVGGKHLEVCSLRNFAPTLIQGRLWAKLLPRRTRAASVSLVMAGSAQAALFQPPLPPRLRRGPWPP